MLFMVKSTISMAIFNSFLYVYQRVASPQVERNRNPKIWCKTPRQWWQKRSAFLALLEAQKHQKQAGPLDSLWQVEDE